MALSLLPAPEFRLVDLGLTPGEAAAGLRHLPGLAFFDSSGNLSKSQALSIIAACPTGKLEGRIEDVTELRKQLQERMVRRPDCGFPLGAACGWIGYEGDFHFGFYDDRLV